MTAREKAIEAAAEWPVGPEPDWLEKAWERAEDRLERVGWDSNDFGPDGLDLRYAVELSLVAAAPHIESALLDRIEAEVKKRMDRCREDYDRDPQAYHRGREDELDMLLDFLTEIREGK